MDFYGGRARGTCVKEKEMVAVKENCDEIEYLMRINVGDRRLRENPNLLLIGSCMKRFPEIVKKHRERLKTQAVLHICLEEIHSNQAGFKVGSMVKYSGIKTVTALTVDGSPHCVQLHYVIEDIKRHFVPEIETMHFVVEKGKVHDVSSEAVKCSRHLSKIQNMLDE